MAKATRGVFRLLLSTARGILGWGNWTFGLIGGFEPSGNKVNGIGLKPGAFQLQVRRLSGYHDVVGHGYLWDSQLKQRNQN